MTDRRVWGEPKLESSLPHIIVDAEGKQRLPALRGISAYKNRAVATRLLNQLRRRPSPLILGDPKTWRVEPVRETE